LLTSLKKRFSEGFEPEVDTAEELTVPLAGVKNTFSHYPFRLVYPLIKQDNLKLADVKEIALMKAYALNRRATFKDYVDLYFIFKSGVDINKLLPAVSRKYEGQFDPRMFLEQLVYLSDVKERSIKFLVDPITPSKIKNYFKKLIQSVKLN
jgi:predicted nucleotidyltransferase component of viral defense system